jgi:hypothetical protein
MRIAIPSHRRAQTLQNKTLAMLKENGIDASLVDVFISDETDSQAYAEIPCNKIVTGSSNVVEKFNFIHFHYPVGEKVVVIEDDIEELVFGYGENVKTKFTKLTSLIDKGFENIPFGGIWGVVPHHNAFFMKNRVTDDLKLVVAHLFGYVSTRDPRLAVTQIGKSDYERTILYYILFGRTVRMDMVGVKTRSYEAAGGMQSDLDGMARFAKEKHAVRYLTQKYPHLCKKNAKKSETSKFDEITLLRNSYSPKKLQEAQRIIDAKIGHTTVW